MIFWSKIELDAVYRGTFEILIFIDYNIGMIVVVYKYGNQIFMCYPIVSISFVMDVQSQKIILVFVNL